MVVYFVGDVDDTALYFLSANGTDTATCGETFLTACKTLDHVLHLFYNTSGDVGRTSGDVGRTSGDVGRTSGDVGRTSGDVGRTSGDVGRTNRDVGRTNRDVGRTSGDVGRTNRDVGRTNRDVGRTNRDVERTLQIVTSESLQINQTLMVSLFMFLRCSTSEIRKREEFLSAKLSSRSTRNIFNKIPLPL